MREPRILITGSSGKVGTRLMRAFPNAAGLDVVGSPDYLRDVLDGPLPDCDVVFHLAGWGSWRAPFEDFRWTLDMASHVIASGKPVIFASSVWADRGPVNAYATIKLAIERMIDLAGGVSVRVGWVGWTDDRFDKADDWHRSVAWSDERLAAEFREALAILRAKDNEGKPPADG